MEYAYTTNNNQKLLLFFHGWGGHPQMMHHLTLSDDYDLLICYDYRNDELPQEIVTLITQYQEINVVAWSFGVWMAAYTCQRYNFPITSAIAYNGTLYPVDEQFGIAPHIAHATLEQLTETSLKKFRRRMMGGLDGLKKLSEHPQNLRPADELYGELEALYTHFAELKVPYHFYQSAVIGSHDMIFPAKAQLTAWQKDKAEIANIEAPHYCFAHFTQWEELL